MTKLLRRGFQYVEALPKRKAFSALLVLGTLVRLTLWAVPHSPLEPGDERTYQNLAVIFIEHGEFSEAVGEPTAYRLPGYPVLIGILWALCG